MLADDSVEGTSLPDWHELQGLAHAHGDGFWLLDLDRFRANLSAFRRAFVGAGWPGTVVAWPLKTSWLPPVVRAATESGALAEVVSRHEYELARALEIDAASIVYNGPLKDIADLDRACGQGARVHLDGPDEVADLISLAGSQSGRTFRVGLRANIDIGQAERGRFGLDAESGCLQRSFAALTAVPNVSVNALHIHISAARDPEAFSRRAQRLVELAAQLWPADQGLDYLDIGGGFAGRLPKALAEQMGAPSPSPADYAAAIVPVLRQHWPQGGPQLFLEPGMALAADTMRFAARVGATKTISGVRHAIAAASVHTLKPTLHHFDMPFTVVRRDGERPEDLPTVVSGWTCMETDVLSRANRLRIERGDWLLFENCGAYTFVLNPRFIRGTPAILSRDPERGWRSVRPADDVASWLEPFRGLE
jgi:diaminopimelate decarboxylase